MTYIMPSRGPAYPMKRTPKGMSGLGDFWSDLVTKLTGGDPNAPVINVAPPPEDTSTSTTSETPTFTLAAASNWVSAGGICKPTSQAFLDKFKELQRQMNRVLDKVGAAKIAVDGAIGPGTIAAFATVAGQTSAGAYGLTTANATTCDSIASQVDALTYQVSNLADFLGVSSSVSSPAPAQTPSYVNPTTGVAQTQGAASSVGDLFANMSTTEKMILGGGAAVVAFLAMKRGKKSSKRR